MRNLLTFLSSLARSYWAGFTPRGQFWLTLAAVMLVIDAAMAASFGATMSTLHAAGFAGVAVVFAFLPDAAIEDWQAGRWLSSLGMWVIAACLGAVAFYTHLGYGASLRVADIQQSGVSNVVHADTRKAVDNGEAQLKLLRDRLAQRTRERDDMIAAAPWAAQVTPEALQGELATTDERIRQERARGGCGPVCAKLMADRAGIEARIGAIKQAHAVGEEIASLTAQVDYAQKGLEQAMARAKDTKFVSSSIANQTSVAAQIFLASTGASMAQAVDPDRTTTSFVNILIAIGGAIAMIVLAPVCVLNAGRHRLTAGQLLAAQSASQSSAALTAGGSPLPAPPSSPRSDAAEGTNPVALTPAALQGGQNTHSTHTREMLQPVWMTDPALKRMWEAFTRDPAGARALAAVAL